MPTLKWGLLSTARINRSLIPPLQASKRNDLVAVASRDATRASAYAKEKGIPQAYGSYEEMLADPDIDVIYNPLPNHLHAEWTIKAVEAGKHVLCEKPLACSVEEVDAIADAAKAANVVVAEGFMYRHHPRTWKVKSLIEEGAIGDLHVVRGAFTFNLSRPDDIRLNPEWGGGSLWDVGCYPLSFARYVIGAEPVEVYGQQYTGPTGIDLTFTAQLRFPRDILVQFDCGFRSQFRMEFECLGREGVLRVPQAYKPAERSTLILVKGDDEKKMKVKGPALYRGEVEDLADAVLKGTTPRVSLADSRANVAAIKALLRSAREGKPIQMETASAAQ